MFKKHSNHVFSFRNSSFVVSNSWEGIIQNENYRTLLHFAIDYCIFVPTSHLRFYFYDTCKNWRGLFGATGLCLFFITLLFGKQWALKNSTLISNLHSTKTLDYRKEKAASKSCVQNWFQRTFEIRKKALPILLQMDYIPLRISTEAVGLYTVNAVSKLCTVLESPEPSWRISMPGFSENRHMKVARHSALSTGHLYSPRVLDCVRGWANLRATLRTKGLSQWKVSKTPSETEPTNFRLVAKCLSHLRYKETWQIVIKQQARKAAYSLFISKLELPSFVLVLFSSVVFFICFFPSFFLSWERIIVIPRKIF